MKQQKNPSVELNGAFTIGQSINWTVFEKQNQTICF